MGVYIGDEAKGDMLGELLTFRRRNVVSEPEPGWNRRSSGGCSSLDCSEHSVSTPSSPAFAASYRLRSGGGAGFDAGMPRSWRRTAPPLSAEDFGREAQRRRSSPPGLEQSLFPAAAC